MNEDELRLRALDVVVLEHLIEAERAVVVEAQRRVEQPPPSG